MNRGRAYRRHHRQRRIIAEYKKALLTWCGDKEKAKESSLRNHSHRTPCSCYMCGNPRKHWNLDTLQEQKLADWCNGNTLDCLS